MRTHSTSRRTLSGAPTCSPLVDSLLNVDSIGARPPHISKSCLGRTDGLSFTIDEMRTDQGEDGQQGASDDFADAYVCRRLRLFTPQAPASRADLRPLLR